MNVTHVESNGSREWSECQWNFKQIKPDRSDQSPNNTKCVQNNIVAASFTKIRKVCSLTYTGIIRTASGKK